MVTKCKSCKESAILGKTRCQKCTEIHNKDYRISTAERIKNGFCTCGNKLEGKQRCNVCSSKAYLVGKSRRKLYISKGLCYCGGRPLSGRKQCSKCWLRSIANSHKVTPKDLLNLWDQQFGLCALTGETLVMGDNASIDHKIPISRGGSSDIKNLQWVTKIANGVKTDLTPEELISFCINVLKKDGYQVAKGDTPANCVLTLRSKWNNHHSSTFRSNGSNSP